MNKTTLLSCCLYLVFAGAAGQSDNRVALVIGNSNYDAGALKNPVNDAKLMKETLEQLDFDVFYGADLSTRTEMLQLIRDFGEARENYDVAFVYYAGHGIQIGAENFLLPTKEIFESEFNVDDNGVSVQKIIRHLNTVTEKVNIFVLDACRNNPFESQWEQTRSMGKSAGLAKMDPPTGSLIAFSTEAGETALDGQGENSVYCQSLCSNLMKEGVSLDQIFRNVRREVLDATGEQQRPIEMSQLTGQVYYLIPPSYHELGIIAKNFFARQNFTSALSAARASLLIEPNNSEMLIVSGHCEFMQSNYGAAIQYYEEALRLRPDSYDAYVSHFSWGDEDEVLGLIEATESQNRLPVIKKALQHFPEDFFIQTLQVELLNQFGQLNEGYRLCGDIQKKIETGSIRYNQGKVTYEKQHSQNIEGEDGAFNTTRQLNDTIAITILQSSKMWLDLESQNYPPVIEKVTSDIEVDSSNPWPHIVLGKCYLGLLREDTNSMHYLDSMCVHYNAGISLANRHDMKVSWLCEYAYNLHELAGITKSNQINRLLKLISEDLLVQTRDKYRETPWAMLSAYYFLAWVSIEDQHTFQTIRTVALAENLLNDPDVIVAFQTRIDRHVDNPIPIENWEVQFLELKFAAFLMAAYKPDCSDQEALTICQQYLDELLVKVKNDPSPLRRYTLDELYKFKSSLKY